MSAEAITDPLILDVVELPEPAGECGCWVDGHVTPEPCGATATHVFVYDGKIGDSERLPRNCPACPDCTPRAEEAQL